MSTRLTLLLSLAGLLLIGSGALSAHAAAAPIVFGAASSPPAGPGPGRLFAVTPASGKVRSTRFAPAGTEAGNSFFVGEDAAAGRLYVPSVAGRMTVLDMHSLRPLAHFLVIRGARVARVVPGAHLLLVLSSRDLAGYSLSGYRALFTLPTGGNAIAVNARQDRAYIGGNMDHDITAVDLPSGKVAVRYPVAGSGDLTFAQGRVFSADMKTGVLSVLDTQSGRITAAKTDEADPHFSYRRIGAATAGFMQIALSPGGDALYAAGFSGRILKFSTQNGALLGEVTLRNGKGANKLSGLAIVDGGKEALTTVENKDEAVLVALASGKVLRRFPGVSSNRWVVAAR